MYLKGSTLHQHQEKAAAGRIHVCLFSVCSAIAFLNHHNHAASEKQAEEPLCLSLAGRVAAVGLSCPTVACYSLEGLSVPGATPVSPCVGCPRSLCTPVILCAEQLLALTLLPCPLGILPLGPCRSLLLAQCRACPADRQLPPAM